MQSISGRRRPPGEDGFGNPWPVRNVTMDSGEALTRWAVRVALALYVLALAVRVTAAGRRPWLAAARLAWTAGCAAYLLHVACAFAYYHHWSHAEAYEATARRTEEVVGLSWGGGLYANYIFTVVWLADVAWWWWGLDRYEARPRGVEWAVQGWLGFLAFNATVVFGSGAVRWLGLAGCVGLAALAVHARRGRAPNSTGSRYV
jgi:hypothetical protein